MHRHPIRLRGWWLIQTCESACSAHALLDRPPQVAHAPIGLLEAAPLGRRAPILHVETEQAAQPILLAPDAHELAPWSRVRRVRDALVVTGRGIAEMSGARIARHAVTADETHRGEAAVPHEIQARE